MAGVRPFGVALLIAGVEEAGLSPVVDRKNDATATSSRGQSLSRIYRLEPSGRYSSWKAAAIGKGSAEAEKLLQAEFKDSLSREEALELALSVVLRCSSNAINREDVEIAFVEENIRRVESRDLTLKTRNTSSS